MIIPLDYSSPAIVRRHFSQSLGASRSAPLEFTTRDKADKAARDRGYMRKGLTLLVFLATLLGALFGLACHALIHDPASLDSLQQGLGLITTIFLRAVKMLIAPLVLATLVSGVGRMGDAGDIGRVALKVMSWFVAASLVVAAAGAGHGRNHRAGRRPAPEDRRGRRSQRIEGAAHQPYPVPDQSGSHLDPGRHGAQRGVADRGLFAAGGRGADPAGRKRQAAARHHRTAGQSGAEDGDVCDDAGANRGLRRRGVGAGARRHRGDRQICLLCRRLLSDRWRCSGRR